LQRGWPKEFGANKKRKPVYQQFNIGGFPTRQVVEVAKAGEILL
jgi:hypothetical protein